MPARRKRDGKVLSQRELVAVVAEAERFPEFMLWVGAGASIDAGIPSAYRIVSDLLREHRTGLGESSPIDDESLRAWAANALPWFKQRIVSGKEPEYQVVLGRLRPSPRLRNKYFSDLDAKADRHSQGYKTLAALLKNRIFDTVLTTNFDHLVARSYSAVSGSVLAEPSKPGALSTMTREPRLIRLHGDLWNKNIANTKRELQAAPKTLMDRVVQLLRDYGLIVVGYSGSDPKIMDHVFERIDRSTSANGIYWCMPKGTAPGFRLERFLRRHPDAVWLVEIDSFRSLVDQIDVATSSRLAVSDSGLLVRDATLNKVFLEITNALVDPVKPLGQDFRKRVVSALALANGLESGAIRIEAIEPSVGWPLTGEQCRLLEDYIGERARKSPQWESISPGSNHVLRNAIPHGLSFSYFAIVHEGRLAWIAFAGRTPYVERDESPFYFAILRALASRSKEKEIL